MVFAEKKTKDGFNYECTDLFGVINIESTTKLDADLLDELVWTVIKSNISAKTITGEVTHSGGVVKYVLERETQWSENDENDTNESWSDTPTSTKKPGKESTPTGNWMMIASLYRQKFAVVLLKLLKKLSKKLERTINT